MVVFDVVSPRCQVIAVRCSCQGWCWAQASDAVAVVGNNQNKLPPSVHSFHSLTTSPHSSPTIQFTQHSIYREVIGFQETAIMADKDTPSSVLIDDSSIAPSAANINHVRQNSLEKHIQNRPDMQELKDRHILLDTNAAPYVLS